MLDLVPSRGAGEWPFGNQSIYFPPGNLHVSFRKTQRHASLRDSVVDNVDTE